MGLVVIGLILVVAGVAAFVTLLIAESRGPVSKWLAWAGVIGFVVGSFIAPILIRGGLDMMATQGAN